ncbi:MAG: DUF2163 domain-containing protein [Rickettsiaceae bacterium H1]|nr:DUF2163 domain-containing protein [Rickettsiaceae bacterium H1]
MFNFITTLKTCLKISLTDNSVIAVTDCDCNLIIEGIEYFAGNSFEYGNIKNSSSLDVDNLRIKSFISSNVITESDILAGKYDRARVEIFQINYENLTQEKNILKFGIITEIKIIDNQFIAEISDFSKKTEQQITDTFSPYCRAKFCDHLCKLDINNFMHRGLVSKVTVPNKKFVDISLSQAQNYYRYGVVKFLSGKNKNHSFEVKQSSVNEIELFFSTPYEIKFGDCYTVFAGCDKLFTTCADKFSNVVNFRGEPHIPGIQKLF